MFAVREWGCVTWGVIATVAVLVVALISLTFYTPQHMTPIQQSGNVVYVHDDSYNDFFLMTYMMGFHSYYYGFVHPYYYSPSYVSRTYGYAPGPRPRYNNPSSPRYRGCALVDVTLAAVVAPEPIAKGSSPVGPRPAPPISRPAPPASRPAPPAVKPAPPVSKPAPRPAPPTSRRPC